MIEIEKIVKNYDSTAALKGVCFHIEKGNLFGLIGPDGAGKTSLFRILCALNSPDEGKIFINGEDHFRSLYKTRSSLGYMPQRFSLYQDLSVEQNLYFFADLFGVTKKDRNERMESLYRFSMLKPFADRKAGALSGGMKQKLALSCALIHTPEILVLDEPTFGVDPLSRREFWNILMELKKQGVTIVVSTAYMEEAELCDQIALIFEGNILDNGTPLELKKKFPYFLYQVKGKNQHKIVEYFIKNQDVRNVQMFGDSVHLSFIHNPSVENWKLWMNECLEITEQKFILPSMEDVFLEKISSKK